MDLVSYVLKVEKIDTIMHFAAQTHVGMSNMSDEVLPQVLPQVLPRGRRRVVLLCRGTQTHLQEPSSAGAWRRGGGGGSCTSDMNSDCTHTPCSSLAIHHHPHIHAHTHTHITTLTIPLCFAVVASLHVTHTVAYMPLRPQHTDNSFGNSLTFTQNNILGTHTLLEAAKVAGMSTLYSTVRVSCIFVSSSHLRATNDISTDSAAT